MAASVKLGGPLKELRLHLCQTSAASQGAREFVEKFYVDLKKNNPKFPILIRECSGIVPRLWARYEFGRERNMAVADKSSNQILEAVKNFSSSK